MTDEERALLLLIGEYVARKLESEIGYISQAKPRHEAFVQAFKEVFEHEPW